MPDKRPFNRRSFFRHGLRELLRPLSAAIEPMQKAAEQVSALDDASRMSPRPSTPYTVPRDASREVPRSVPLEVWLRPPGALAEPQFLDTCSRCGNCVSACPAHCIQIDATGARGGGA